MADSVDKCRISHLKVVCPDGTDFTNKLYANGRHQCEVVVEVIKERINDFGEWERIELSKQELASVSIVAFSSEGVQALPSGWKCDEVKNIYCKGLWTREKNGDPEPDSYVSPPLVQRVYRYLSFSSQGDMSAVAVIAHMILDHRVYLSKTLEEGGCFNSFVTIQPVTPFRLSVKDLTVDVDYAVSQTEFHARVIYWTPPQGVVFVENQGLDRPLGMEYEGDHFQTCYAYTKIGNSSPHKAGVVTKAVGAIMREDIFKPYGSSMYNYYVRTGYRPTIMRAFTAYSLYLKVDRVENSQSTWSLIDNFGNLQEFIMDSAGSGSTDGVLLRDKGPDTRLITFEIRLPSGQQISRELYANGRHQCKVEVLVSVEHKQAGGGYLPGELTAAERDSVTVTRYSANIYEPLPPGWSCDKQKNIYDTGLWPATLEDEGIEESVLTDERSSIGRIELVDRYMRLESNFPIQEVRFMASININGVTYTTNYSVGDQQFNSYVYIRAERAYAGLHVAQLVQYVDYSAYTDDKCDVDVYYWTPPSGLRFLVNRGLDTHLFPPAEGLNFRTSYNKRNAQQSFYKAGVVVNKDVVNPSVLLADIFTAPPGAYQKTVRFDQRPTIMRAVRCRGNYNVTLDADSRTKWRLWDNFGCEHVYGFEQADGGNIIRLIEG